MRLGRQLLAAVLLAGDLACDTSDAGALGRLRQALSTMSFRDGELPTAAYAETRDTRILEGQPSATAGTATPLEVAGGGLNGRSTALMRWNLAPLPPQSRILAVRMDLF